MAAQKKQNVSKIARGVRDDLARALAGASELAADLGTDLGETVRDRIHGPIEEASRVAGALAQFLETMAGGTTPSATPAVRRGAGRPKGSGRKPGRPKGSEQKGETGMKKRGQRGVRANLSAEDIEAALEKTGGVKSRAAKEIGVSITTFNKYLDAL